MSDMKTLNDPATTWDPWLASGVLHLAQALAAKTSQLAGLRREAPALSAPSLPLNQHPAKRSRTLEEGPAAAPSCPQQDQQRSAQAFSPTRDLHSGRPLRQAHTNALQRGMVAWATHWHPRVRQAALGALLAIHGLPLVESQVRSFPAASQHTLRLLAGSPAAQYPSEIFHSASPWAHCPQTQSEATSERLLEASYWAAVTALADDHPGVRLQALLLVTGLGAAHPHQQLLSARFWQFQAPQVSN